MSNDDKPHRGSRSKATLRTVRSTSKSAVKRGTATKTSPKLLKLPRPEMHPLDRAIAELRGQLTKNPDDAITLNRLGALFYRRGDLEQAEGFLRKAISVSPSRPNVWNNLGNVLCDMGRMRDGIVAYEHALAIEKSEGSAPSSEAQMNLDMARAEYKLIQERIEYLEKAAQLEVMSSEALNALGGGYLLRAERARALEAFRKALKLEPRNVSAALNVAFTHTLNMDQNADFTAACAEIAEALVRFSNEARLHIHLAELQENAGLLEDAQERYLRAIEVEPLSLDAYDLLGRLRQALHQNDLNDEIAEGVRAVLEKARADCDAAGGAQAAFVKAFAKIALARFERKAVPEPQEVDARLRDSASLANCKSQDESGKLEVDVAVRASLLRAQLLETDGRRTEAQVVLDNLAPGTSGIVNGRVSFECALLSLRAGDVDEALKRFDRAILANPQDARTYHWLRFTFEGFRRYYTEKVRATSAVRLNPRDAIAFFHLGLASLSVMKDEEALFNFTRALEIDPRMSDASCGRGKALQRQGHLDEAEAAYKRALEIDETNTEARRLLEVLSAKRKG